MTEHTWEYADEPRAIVTAFELAVEDTPTIALDMDEVIFPLNELVVLPTLRRQGIRLTLDDIIAYNYEDCLTPSEARAAVRCFKSESLYDSWHLTQAEELVLRRLRARGRVIAVSKPMVQHITSKWSYLTRAGFSPEDIVLTGDKSLVHFDVLVDDSPDVLNALPPEKTIVFDRPWNRSVTDRIRVERFSDIPEAVELVLGEGR